MSFHSSILHCFVDASRDALCIQTTFSIGHWFLIVLLFSQTPALVWLVYIWVVYSYYQLSIYQSIGLSVRPSVRPSISLCLYHSSLCPYLSLCLSVHLSICFFKHLQTYQKKSYLTILYDIIILYNDYTVVSQELSGLVWRGLAPLNPLGQWCFCQCPAPVSLVTTGGPGASAEGWCAKRLKISAETNWMGGLVVCGSLLDDIY